MIGWQRFGRHDVKACACEMAGRESADQIFRRHARAASDIDEVGAAFHGGKARGIEQAQGLGRFGCGQDD
jgi:hypothetical protein